MLNFLEFDTSLLPEESVDVVICGTGIGGLTTALTLKELGITPLVVTRGIGNTYYSQGGIACPVSKEDSTELHFVDTVKAGRNLNNVRAVRILVEEAIFSIAKLEKWGVRFDKDEKGYKLTTEGGHSVPRVLKVRDYTGKAIYETLWNRLKDYSIPVVEGELEEILGEEKVEGILLYTEGSYKFIRTKILVLATGGNASLFKYTTNPSRVRGDAIGIALRAGVKLKNPEFIQFHPTVFKGTNLLISEAVRGEGAILLDEKGNRFVNELEPRDVVARAIYRKIKEGGEVFLDMRQLEGKCRIEERFPTIYSFLKEKGYDPYRDIIPVTPAAHYFIGGLDVDMFGRTEVEGLFAVGECACTGVHGANRLASNSLLEGIVFGLRVAHKIFIDINSYKVYKKHFKNVRKKTIKCSVDMEQLKGNMWEFVGMEREGSDLKNFVDELLKFIEEGMNWEPTVENRKKYDLILNAFASAYCALRRKESRGVHYRKDYPFEREEYRKDSYFDLTCFLT